MTIREQVSKDAEVQAIQEAINRHIPLCYCFDCTGKAPVFWEAEDLSKLKGALIVNVCGIPL